MKAPVDWVNQFWELFGTPQAFEYVLGDVNIVDTFEVEVGSVDGVEDSLVNLDPEVLEFALDIDDDCEV